MSKMGIVCASDKELAPFLPGIQNHKTTQKVMLDIHQGIPHGPNLAALFWGMCKVHAAVATHRLVDRCGVDMVVNADTCGRMEPGMDIFSTVIAARLFVTMSARLCRPTFILG